MRAALAGHDRRAQPPELHQRAGHVDVVVAGHHHLGDLVQRPPPVGRGGVTGDHDRSGPVSREEPRGGVELERPAHHRDRRRLVLPSGPTGRPLGLGRAGRPVVLGADGAGAGQHHVGHAAEGEEERPVGGTAERPRAAGHRDAPVERRHHVHEHPRPLRGRGPLLGRHQGVDVVHLDGIGPEPAHGEEGSGGRGRWQDAPQSHRGTAHDAHGLPHLPALRGELRSGDHAPGCTGRG